MPQKERASPLAHLGRLLAQLRGERGLDREQLAESSGVDSEIIREIEESRGVPLVHVTHIDALLAACNANLTELAAFEELMVRGENRPERIHVREVESLLRTIEKLQDKVETLENELAARDSAMIREFQMQSIRLLEKTMESAGMTREEMRRLMSELRAEDLT